MKSVIKLACGFNLSLLVALLSTSPAVARTQEQINEDWQFARFGSMADGTTKSEPVGLELPATDTRSWRTLNLPHDWGIEGPFRSDLPGETGKLPWAGIGWYRKAIEVSAEDQGKRIFIHFDGAMSHAQVWLNGKKIGEWPYGYNSFRFELTDHLNYGAENVLAVRLDNPEESSRWYPGSGIYRKVTLIKTAPVHVAQWGTTITTPKITDQQADIAVQTKLRNQSDKPVQATIVHHFSKRGEKGVLVSSKEQHVILEADKTKNIELTTPMPNPVLWNLETCQLYTATTEIRVDGKVIDLMSTDFGIRSIKFTADDGFHLNGKRVQIQGTCMHHDLGPLGAAFNVRAAERQIEKLQEMGCNAIRFSHNPPAPEYLDLCDRMGMLAIDEAFDCWKRGKKKHDYSTLWNEWHERDLQAMIRRDRNHPSIIMWSTGNEIKEFTKPEEGIPLSNRLREIAHAEDPTRPMTCGVSKKPGGFNGMQETLDVFGVNYKNSGYYSEFRKQNPTIPAYASETASSFASRGEYVFPAVAGKKAGLSKDFHVSSFGLYSAPWGSIPDEVFQALDENPFMAGEFVWTGFDYIGEPTPYNKDRTNLLNFHTKKEREDYLNYMDSLGGIPSRSSYFGILDLCGFKKDLFYQYKSQWLPNEPTAHILPHWNWPERVGQVTPVHVYTSGDEAELFLNGKSLGKQTRTKNQYRFQWNDVEYQPGELKVVTWKDGKAWAEDIVKTTAEAAAVTLEADRIEIAADGKDLAFITVRIADKNGLTVPTADNPVAFQIEGPGEIIAVGNGDPTSHTSFQAKEQKAFNGLCLVIIRSVKGQAGELIIRATSENLKTSQLNMITTEKNM
jgi:beta-galactosidase